MFALKQMVKIANVNCRAELHGDDHVIATDIKIEVKVPNDLLAEFHPDLRHFLYIKDDNPEQGELTLSDAERFTKLRMPLLGPIKWGWEGAGYTLVVDYGISESSAIVLGDVEIDHFVLAPQEGGTVSIAFRAIAKPREDDIGKLVSLIQQENGITLDPPSPAKAADLVIDKAKRKAKTVEGVE